jgi:hypothetical protein
MPVPPFPDTPRDQAPQLIYTKNFKGVNLNVPRAAIPDNQFAWMENLMPVDHGNLRAMYREGPNVYTAPGGKTIVNVVFFNIGTAPQAIVFLNDGTAQQFNTSSGFVVNVSTVVGTFFAGGFLPAAAQWNASGIVIATEATNPNGYYAWDGTTLFGPGSASPAWLNNGAPTTMPSGVHGNAIEVYQNRAWVAKPPTSTVPATLTVTAPANGADFLTADGSNSTPQQDSSLRYQFNVLRQSNGFLYLFGDSNTSAVSNVQTGGTPPVTTYANQNVDPQVGCAFGNTAQLFGQAVIFANPHGVWVLSGGVVQKASHELDRLFSNANFSIVPTAGVASIFGTKCYVILLNAPDQNNTSRNLLLLWDTRQWWVASTINTGTLAVYGQEFNSILTAWGTDGTNLFKLFQAPSTALQKVLKSKLHATGDDDNGFITYKKLYRFYFESEDYSGDGVTLTGTMDTDMTGVALTVSNLGAALIFLNNSAQTLIFVNSLSQTLIFTSATAGIVGSDVAAYGRLLGITETVVGGDFALVAYLMVYSYDATYLG